jgi:Ca-activated chloride channel family protein
MVLTRFVEWPWALLLIGGLPLAALLVFRVERRSRAKRFAQLGTRAMLVRLAPLATRLGPGRTLRLTLALALCGVAFAGPRWGLTPTVTHSRGVDVVLAVDASQSMLAPDVPPSRLAAMKAVVQQLRAHAPTDRFALVAFAGHSYVLSPLTTDHGALDLYLTNLDPSTVGVGGTSVADAIRQATTLLSTRRGDAGRAIVVLSDGESFEPLAAVTAAAKQAGEAGIQLITVGIGTQHGAVIPVPAPTGGMTVKKDAAGQVVITHYMPTVLQQAAQVAAHGVFIPATATDPATQIAQVLQGLTAQVRATASGVDLALQFQWFVGLAVLLVMLDTLLMLRVRRRRLRSPDAVPVPAAVRVPPVSARHAAGVAATVLLAATTMTTLACREPTPPAPQATVPPPDTARIALYNHGTHLLHQDSLAPAISLLDAAQASADSTVQFRSAFNDGWAHLVTSLRTITTLAHGGSTADSLLVAIAPTAGDSARQAAAAYVNQHLDATLAQYQAALVRNPTDADAKWNYELAYRLRDARRKTAPGNGNKKDNKKNDNKKDSKDKKNKQQKNQQQKQPKPQDKQHAKQKDKNGKDKQQKGKNKNTPPIQQIKLPPQQAEQLLNAIGQYEQKAAKAKPVPAAPAPRGKDW